MHDDCCGDVHGDEGLVGSPRSTWHAVTFQGLTDRENFLANNACCPCNDCGVSVGRAMMVRLTDELCGGAEHIHTVWAVLLALAKAERGWHSFVIKDVAGYLDSNIEHARAAVDALTSVGLVRRMSMSSTLYEPTELLKDRFEKAAAR